MPRQTATSTVQPRATTRLAWAIYLLLHTVATVLAFLARSYAPSFHDPLPFFSRAWLYLPSNFAFPTIGALIAARHPRNPIGWLLLSNGLVGVFGQFAEGYWRYALFVRPGALPAGGADAVGERAAVFHRRASQRVADLVLSDRAPTVAALVDRGVVDHFWGSHEFRRACVHAWSARPERHNHESLRSFKRCPILAVQRRSRCVHAVARCPRRSFVTDCAVPAGQWRRAAADQIARVCARDLWRLVRNDQLLRHANGEAIADRQYALRGSGARSCVRRRGSRHRHPALPPVGHRRDHSANAGLRRADADARPGVPGLYSAQSYAGRTAGRWLRAGDRGLDAGDRRAIQPVAATYSEPDRQALLPPQVRRRQGTGRLRRDCA